MALTNGEQYELYLRVRGKLQAAAARGVDSKTLKKMWSKLNDDERTVVGRYMFPRLIGDVRNALRADSLKRIIKEAEAVPVRRMSPPRKFALSEEMNVLASVEVERHISGDHETLNQAVHYLELTRLAFEVGGVSKAIGDCTRPEILQLALDAHSAAEGHLRKERWLVRLADALTQERVTYVKELSSDALRTVVLLLKKAA